MTRNELLEIAKAAGLGSVLTHNGGEPQIFIEGADWSEEVERFAAMLIAKQDDDWKAATHVELEAAIEATKEKAAKKCELFSEDTEFDVGYVCRALAAAIREMK